MDCAQVEELAAGYAVNALTEGERREFEAHVSACPQCTRQVREYRALAGLLPLAVEPARPPAGLKARLLARARQDVEASRREASSARSRAGWTRLLRRPALALATAALALAAVAGLAVWNVRLESTNDDRAEEIARLREGVRIAVARGTEAAPGASADLVYVAERQLAVLRVQGLPPLPADKTYQVWFIAGDKPVSAGLLQVSPASRETISVVNGDPRRFQLIAVTVEPSGGVPQPTGQIVLKGEL